MAETIFLANRGVGFAPLIQSRTFVLSHATTNQLVSSDDVIQRWTAHATAASSSSAIVMAGSHWVPSRGGVPRNPFQCSLTRWAVA